MKRGISHDRARTAAIVAALVIAGFGIIAALHGPWTLRGLGWNRVAATLQETGPLLLCGLAAAIAFRAGVLNIGGHGQYLLGAATFIALGTTHRPAGPALMVLGIALLAAGAVGAAWALLAQALERWRGVPVVLSTILLNFVAVWLVAWLVEHPLRDPATTAPQTALLADDLHLGLVLDGTRLHLGVVLAVLAVPLVWLVQRRSALGFELDAVGLNPDAAAANGIPVARRQALAMAVSGALAAVAGGLQAAGVTWFMSNASPSYGFAGVAVALLGRLHPLGITIAALFFAALDTAARVAERRHGIPHDVADVVKGVAVLVALVVAAWALRRRTRTVAA